MLKKQLGVPEISELTGLKVATVHSYRHHKRIPKQDGFVGQSPYWWQPGRIDKWLKERSK